MCVCVCVCTCVRACDTSSGDAPHSTVSQPTNEDTMMDLDRTEVSEEILMSYPYSMYIDECTQLITKHPDMK